MTGKEALQIIKTYNYYNGAEEYLGQKCIHPDYLEAKSKYKEAQDIVEKDLETLELLRNECEEIVFFFESRSKVRKWYDDEKRRSTRRSG